MAKQNETNEVTGRTRRSYVSQADVPRHSVKAALRIAEALRDEFAKQPTRPLQVAAALEMQPKSSRFRTLAGASLAYGLTEGGPNAELISLTELGLRAVSPTEEGDDVAALREAFLRPRVVREFLEKYDGNKLPSQRIARNVLENLGVAPDATERTFDLIVRGADDLGLLTEIKGTKHVDLRSPVRPEVPGDPLLYVEGEEEDPGEALASPSDVQEAAAEEATGVAPPSLKENRRVFISHGKKRKIVEQVKELLVYGDFEPVVSVERETTAKPVPDKVMDDMRSCAAGIIHVGPDRTIEDAEGNQHHLLNENVLIEIGAAMALYGGKFILLVEKGTTLPSNLQGLYEVRFAGEGLDHDATLRLLKAFSEFKS
jgi:predicted nucleotide-binding protein